MATITKTEPCSCPQNSPKLEEGKDVETCQNLANPWIIEDCRVIKPYLGGWKHKITDTVYLNAASQTAPSTVCRNCCSTSTQYVHTNEEHVQTPVDHATQMWRRDCFVISESDKYMTSRPYETYKEMEARLNRDGNARIIQRNYRAYRLAKYIRECASEYRRRVEECRRYEEEKAEIYRRRHCQEISRKVYPKKRADFEMLYELIDRWRADCLNDVKKKFYKAGRSAENYAILCKTVEMLRTIERHNLAVRESYAKKKRVRFLTFHCEPIRWHGYKGKMVEMITMRTQRARKYKETYDHLCDTSGTVEARMELLMMLRNSLDNVNTREAIELASLFTQELRLLALGNRKMNLDNLRERIIQAYLSFVKTTNDCFAEGEDCAPLREPLEPRTKLCIRCQRLVSYSRIAVHCGVMTASTCIGCTALGKRVIRQVNYNPYMYILNSVRVEERNRHCYSAIAFMMQVEDIYHLVNVIWRGRSVLSENGDIYVLKLIRFRMDEEWAPWNSILLTDEEAEVHRNIKNHEVVYSEIFLRHIRLTHQTAKQYFKRLVVMEKNFRDSSRYYMIQNRADYKPSVTVENYDVSNVRLPV